MERQPDRSHIDRYQMALQYIRCTVFRKGDCDTDHCLVLSKVRERLAVRFRLRKLNELEVRKQYQTEISNRFAALETLSDGEDINRAWENIKENMTLS